MTTYQCKQSSTSKLRPVSFMRQQQPPSGGSGSGGCAPAGGNGGRNGAQNGNNAMEIFGDMNLGLVMLVLLVLHLMQYAMRDPCTC